MSLVSHLSFHQELTHRPALYLISKIEVCMFNKKNTFLGEV